jgi:hypothetical protein
MWLSGPQSVTFSCMHKRWASSSLCISCAGAQSYITGTIEQHILHQEGPLMSDRASILLVQPGNWLLNWEHQLLSSHRALVCSSPALRRLCLSITGEWSKVSAVNLELCAVRCLYFAEAGLLWSHIGCALSVICSNLDRFCVQMHFKDFGSGIKHEGKIKGVESGHDQ